MLERFFNRLRRRGIAIDGSLHRDVHFGRVEGWVWAPGSDRNPLWIHLRADGETFGTARTGIWRRDVVEAGRSDHARVGFRRYVPEAFYDGQHRTIEAVVPSHGFELKRSPMTLRLGSTLADAHELCGLMPPVQSVRVRGWVIWGGARSRALDLEVFEDGRPLASLAANAPRRDIAQALPGAHRCGFAFSLPDRFLEPGERTLSVQVSGTGIDIPGSPQVLDGETLRSDIESRIERNLAQIDRSLDRLQALGAWRRGGAAG